ncbi:MAG: hypothetical protein JHC93_03675 [Parachlamydiales bacterium]|nr:hypothetical protein [Parachlamydiales bacterium]
MANFVTIDLETTPLIKPPSTENTHSHWRGRQMCIDSKGILKVGLGAAFDLSLVFMFCLGIAAIALNPQSDETKVLGSAISANAAGIIADRSKAKTTIFNVLRQANSEVLSKKVDLIFNLYILSGLLMGVGLFGYGTFSSQLSHDAMPVMGMTMAIFSAASLIERNCFRNTN